MEAAIKARRKATGARSAQRIPIFIVSLLFYEILIKCNLATSSNQRFVLHNNKKEENKND